MLRCLVFLCACLPLLAHGEACVIHAQGDRSDVKVCQQNRSIPKNLFRSGFCQPRLKGQKVAVAYSDKCPTGAFGVCRNVQVSSLSYRQDIHYYGVASDANYLKLYCERQNRGTWFGQ